MIRVGIVIRKWIAAAAVSVISCAGRIALFASRAKQRDYAIIGSSLLALGLCAVHWWHPGAVIASFDLPPQLDPSIMVRKALPAWTTAQSFFGQLDGYFTFVPFMALWWALDRAMGPSLGEIALFYAMLASAWLGAYNLARASGTTVAAAAACAWLYTVNPFTQVATGGLTQSAFLALLPWFASIVMLAARFPEKRARMRFALGAFSFAALPALGITPQLVFQFAVAAVVVVFCCAFFADDRHQFLSWALRSGALAIGASLWWVVPDALSFLGATIPHPTGLSPSSWTFARSSLLNNMRFLWIWTWAFPEYFPSAPVYDANPFTYASGFFAFGSGLVGLIRLRGRRLSVARYSLACVLVMMFITKGAHAPLSWLNELLWKIPGMFLFLDPAGGTGLALLLLGLVSALVFDSIFIGVGYFDPRRSGLRVLALAAAVSIACLSGIAMLSGAIFRGEVIASDGSLLPSEYVRVPTYWTRAAAYLNGTRRGAGVLLLPPVLGTGYDVQYDFGYYGTDSLPQDLILRPLLYLHPAGTWGYISHPEAQSASDALNQLIDERSPLAERLMRNLGIEYVMFRNDIVDESHAWFSDKDVRQLLGVAPRRFGPLSIYDIGRSSARFLLSQDWIADYFPGATPGQLAELSVLEEDTPRVAMQDIPRLLTEAPTLTEQAPDYSSLSSPPGGTPAYGGSKGVDRLVSLGGAIPDDAGVVLSRHANEEIRASFAAIPPEEVLVDLPFRETRQLRWRGDSLPVAKTLAADFSARQAHLTAEVTNGDRRTLESDVLLLVPRASLKYQLAYHLLVGAASYSPSTNVRPADLILDFPGVLIAPGAQSMVVVGLRLPSRKNAARQATTRGAGGHEFRYSSLLYFRRAHPVVSQPIGVGNYEDSEPAKDLGAIVLGMHAADQPVIEVSPGTSTIQGLNASVAFEYAGRPYRCPMYLTLSQSIDVEAAIVSCLRQNLIGVSAGELVRAKVAGISFGYALGAIADTQAEELELADLEQSGRITVMGNPVLDGASLPKPSVISAAQVLRTSLQPGDNGSIGVALLSPTPGPLRVGQLVSAATAMGPVDAAVVTRVTSQGIDIREADGQAAWLPYAAERSITVTGYQVPITVRWANVTRERIDAFLTLESNGCVRESAMMHLATLAAGVVRTYSQRLSSNADLSGRAAFNLGQLLQGKAERPLAVSVSCHLDLSPEEVGTVRFRLALLGHSGSSLPVAFGGAARVVSSQPGGVVTQQIADTPNGALSVRAGRLPSSASVVTVGEAPTHGQELDACGIPGSHCGSDGVIISIPHGFRGLAVMSQLYSWSWLGIYLGHGIGFPPHVRVDGWRNGWFVPLGGVLIVLNLATAFEAISLAVSLSVLVWYAQRAARVGSRG